MSKPVETILSNFVGIHNLLEYAQRNDVRRLLYVSSSEVYGKIETEDSFKEGTYGVVNFDDVRSSYSVGKISSEMICKAYSLEYGIETVIVRPGHIYGPSLSGKDKRVSSDFAYKAAIGMPLELKSTGLQRRSYCYSVDCAVQLLVALLRGETGQAYNIGHDEITTIREMAQIYAEAGGVSLKVVEPSDEEIKTFNPMNNSSLNNNRIKELGYRDGFSVEEGLTHTVKILKELLV